MVSASCGAPATTTTLSKATWPRITSPRSKVSPLVGAFKKNPLTTGAVSRLPSTLWFAEFEIAWLPTPSAALALP